MLFPPREATTTAEPPEPFTFQHSEFIIYKQNIQEFVGPAGRHFVLFSVFCGLFIRVHSYYYSSFACFFAKIFS